MLIHPHSFNPFHPEIFQNVSQVLCRESVSGRCYWEVEWIGGGISIAVSYKGIDRTGGLKLSGFGRNDQSWCVEYNFQNFSFWHNNQETRLTPICSNKIGVYVDCRAGTLSFYSVSDAMTLLHRVQTTFTDTLYPGFRMMYRDASAKML